MARRAVSLGAHACFALDTPLQHLSFTVLCVLREGKRGGPRASATRREPRPPFSLGAGARQVLSELRRLALPDRYPTYWIRTDAERRLELAVRADFASRLPSPFRLGIHARLETALMRLDPFAIERLERAIQADLDAAVGEVA